MGRDRRAGDGAPRLDDTSTQLSARRTASVRLWAPGRRAGRGERVTRGRCGVASHALWHVVATQSSAPVAWAVCGTPGLAARWGSRGRAAARAGGPAVD